MIDRMEFDVEGLLIVYLVWAWKKTRESDVGLYQLRAVSLTKRHAGYAKAVAKADGCKVVVEQSWAEHLYGLSMLGVQSGEEPPDGYEGIELGE